MNVFDARAIGARKFQRFAFHVTIRYEDLWTVDLDSIVLLIARRMIAKVHGQRDVEMFLESLVDVNFEGLRLGGGLFDIDKAVDKCAKFVEPIETRQLIGVDVH